MIQSKLPNEERKHLYHIYFDDNPYKLEHCRACNCDCFKTKDTCNTSYPDAVCETKQLSTEEILNYALIYSPDYQLTNDNVGQMLILSKRDTLKS